MKFTTQAKDSNLRRILKKVSEQQTSTRAELAKQLGISPATMSAHVELLIELGYLRFGSEGRSSGGRKPVTLEINPNSILVVGVSVLKHDAVASLVNLQGDIIGRHHQVYKLPITEDVILDAVFTCIKHVMEYAPNPADVAGIGVGMHGVVNYSNGTLIHSPAHGWRNVAVKEIIQNEYHLPVFVDNDMRVNILAEKWFGKYRTLKTYLYLGLDEGIGGGIIINGMIYRGDTQAAGEVGHIRVKENGALCICGNYGCLETLASIQSILDSALTKIRLGYSSFLLEKIGGKSLDNITFEMLVDAAKDNDPLCLEVFREVGMYVGIALAGVLNFFNPEAVIIGGRVTDAWRYLKTPIRETVKRQSMPECAASVQILKASFPGMSGDLGAAALYIDHLFEEKIMY